MDIKLVYSTFPTITAAEAAARHLVEARLAACANILPSMVSIYEWKGAIERSEEVVLILKTTAARASNLMEALARAHPYETPAILLLPVEAAAAPFAAWIADATHP